MECSRCDQRYDQEARQPKLLPCGHTFCVSCLQGAGQCFSDGKAFPGVDCLPDDLYTLGLVTGDIRRHPDDPGPGALQLWCRGCSAAASDCCVDDGHELVPSRVRWHEEVLERLEALAAALDDSDPHEEDEALEQLVGSAGVTVTLVDGDEVLTSTVQLGGSGEEGSDESWALRDLLLLALRGQGKEEEEEFFPFCAPPDTPPEESMLPFGLGGVPFDVDPAEGKKDQSQPGPGLPCLDDEDLHAPMVALAEDTEDADPPPRADSPGKVRKLMAFDCAGAGKLEELKLEELKLEELKLEELKLEELKRVAPDLEELKLEELKLEELKRVAPDLEELQVENLTREHLEVIQGMAKLRRLDAVGPQMWTDPFLVPPLAHDGGLEFLRVGLSAPTAASLIYAHNRTLRHVQVVLPLQIRRSAYFENLDYHLGGHVTEHIVRSPWFPRREPGDFPVLERVEFVEEPRSSYVMNACWIVGKDIDRVERILPGVQLKHTCPLIPFDESEKDLEYMHLFF